MADGIELYDKCIAEIMTMLEPYEKKSLYIEEKPSWQDAGKHNMVLKSDMAYELGGGDLPAPSGAGYLTSEDMLDDELLLYGPDLQDIGEDRPYARLVVIKLDSGKIDRDNKDNALYNVLRDIEYERYRMEPALA